MTATDLLDGLLDRTVVPGYSRLGFAVRRRFWSATDPAPGALAGRTVLVTGANSGIGAAIVAGAAALGATVLMTVRDPARGQAARRDVPILLSVGYSACHWCHVMAHESFEDATVAEVMNRDFVPVKVDREERPDIDAIYMRATTAMTGNGGWPMTCILTPDGQPVLTVDSTTTRSHPELNPQLTIDDERVTSGRAFTVRTEPGDTQWRVVAGRLADNQATFMLAMPLWAVGPAVASRIDALPGAAPFERCGHCDTCEREVARTAATA